VDLAEWNNHNHQQFEYPGTRNTAGFALPNLPNPEKIIIIIHLLGLAPAG
jgi:hypothetical protein